MNRVYSVAQINHYIGNLFGQDFLLNQVSVRGEISGLKDHPSGHLYFNLKDEKSVLSVVMFQGNRLKGLHTALRDGMKVVVTGSVELYEAGGKYSLYAKTVEEDGEGELYRQFLALKAKLEEMGMFDPAYKKPIPKYSFRVGVVTASSGAAFQDIIRVTRERNPYVEIILSPALVQGADAPRSIVAAIQKLDAVKPDVMIVGRGGGSYEDLSCFNDEAVARAIFDAETPVISAVGHEVDFTIADFVADYRAATPSQAAEIAVFEYRVFRDKLLKEEEKEKRALLLQISDYGKELKLKEASLRAVHPKNLLREKTEKVSAIHERLVRAYGDRIEEMKRRIQDTPLKLSHAAEKTLASLKERVAVYSARLSGVSPLEKLKQGYGFIEHSGHTVRSAHELAPGNEFSVTLHDGRITAEVKEVSDVFSAPQ